MRRIWGGKREGAYSINIHILQCGVIRVAETVAFGKRFDLFETAGQLSASDKGRVTLPVFSYLIEHPKGLILVDAGWCREISPQGSYDSKAAAAVLPAHLAAFFHPSVSKGKAIHEQLAAMGIQPEDLDYVLLTHLDPDHVAGLRHVSKARRIILPEDEYFWSCRAVYKARQPQDLWLPYPIERQYYRGSPLGPNHWVIDVFAAVEIYTMLRDYAGKVTVKIASLAASAASVVAMAGDTVQMSPTALLMVHDPSTIAMGNTRDMEKAIAALNEVKEAIVNAYAAKSGLRRSKIADLMSEETWLNAKKAVELGFADEVLYEGKEPAAEEPESNDAVSVDAQIFSTRVMDRAILNRLGVEEQPPAPTIGMDGKTEDGSVPFQILIDQLEFLR